MDSTTLLVMWATVMGASTASFGCVLVERWSRGLSAGGRSHCVCGRQLRGWENIPVLSWLMLRGRARCCKVPIPQWYMWAEVGGAVLWGTLALLGWVGIMLALAVSAGVISVGIQVKKAQLRRA